ncbi:hypothetical protein CHARACLAT_004454 [Characodon lateralis]|uniref:Uncharacterized protein n=1 Tax=Characodon lateralis TaxID=208331 RepID=A0ABU7DE61_9TELE|nr:hypothetical protein [Characodon lateralis]
MTSYHKTEYHMESFAIPLGEICPWCRPNNWHKMTEKANLHHENISHQYGTTRFYFIFPKQPGFLVILESSQFSRLANAWLWTLAAFSLISSLVLVPDYNSIHAVFTHRLGDVDKMGPKDEVSGLKQYLQQ